MSEIICFFLISVGIYKFMQFLQKIANIKYLHYKEQLCSLILIILGNKLYLITFYFYDALFVGGSVASYKFMNYHLQMEMFGKQSVITRI